MRLHLLFACLAAAAHCTPVSQPAEHTAVDADSATAAPTLKCFKDDALKSWVKKMDPSCFTNVDCIKNCDKTVECTFTKLGIWDHDKGMLDTDKAKETLGELYLPELKDTEVKVFDTFYKIHKEVHGGTLNHHVLADGRADSCCDADCRRQSISSHDVASWV
ncbi:hypothetical protein GQ42DRAFT_152800 [Ramicandelaber brevisporus]|nr:hypothetical protein GQ42DRAFT_152800 [Ramicandelaber brevisporus]